MFGESQKWTHCGSKQPPIMLFMGSAHRHLERLISTSPQRKDPEMKAFCLKHQTHHVMHDGLLFVSFIGLLAWLWHCKSAHTYRYTVDTRGGNRLQSQLPNECVYLQSTRVYGDYQLKIGSITTSSRYTHTATDSSQQNVATTTYNAFKVIHICVLKQLHSKDSVLASGLWCLKCTT